MRVRQTHRSKSRRGISTVVSTLLMVVVVVAASSIAILWSTGALQQLSDYFGNQTSAVQEAIAIEDVYYNRTASNVCAASKPDHCIMPYVRNIGPVAVFLTAIFITNSTRITEITLTRPITIGAGQLAIIPCYASSTSCILPAKYYPSALTTVTIQVITSRGTSDIFQLFIAT